MAPHTNMNLSRISGDSSVTPPETITPLVRAFPGYGGEALDDSLVTSVYFMTNTNTSGAGSIADAPDGAYIVPLVAGKITKDTQVLLPQNNVRFLGQLAPGHLSVNGTSTYNPNPLVRFTGSNTLWSHLSIRASSADGVQNSHKPFEIFDNVGSSAISGVVLSNISSHFGTDDAGSIWTGASNVTYYRMLTSHGAERSGVGGNPDYGYVVGGGSDRVTLFQNLLMHNGRSPMIQNVGNAQLVNNIVYAAYGGVTSQVWSINQAMNVNVHDNLDIRPIATPSNVWLGQSSAAVLSTYLNNNRWRNCAGTYSDMGTHTSVGNEGLKPNTPHSMPTLSAITDLATLESSILPKVGAYHHRDFIDDDVMNIINTCSVHPRHQTAEGYFTDPWLTGPTGTALTLWDQGAVDGISDAAKASLGISAGTNLLSPNDGRWEAVVDHHTGGLLSADLA